MTVSWLDVSDTEPRIYYTVGATSTTVFSVPFVYFDTADLKVYVDGVLQSSTLYTVSDPEIESGGTVTFLSALTDCDVGIVRDIVVDLSTHIPTFGPLDVAGLNLQFSRIIALLQQIDSKFDRSVHLIDADPTTDMEVPLVAARQGRIAAFDATTGALTVTENLTSTFDALLSGALVAQAGFNSLVDVADIAAMRLLTPIAGQVVSVRGYYTAADGGGGIFYWNAADTTTHNGATYIQPLAGGTGRWIRISDGSKSLKWWGAKGDSVDDATAVTQAIGDWKTEANGGRGYELVVPTGIYPADTWPAIITLEPGASIRGQGRPTFKHTGTGTAFDISQPSGSGPLGPHLENLRFQGGASTSDLMHINNQMRMVMRNVDLKNAGSSYRALLLEFVITMLIEHITIGRTHDYAPGTGIQLGTGTLAATSCNNVTIINPVIEGISASGGIGLDITNAFMTRIVGGAIESNYRGAHIRANAHATTFSNVDFEDNSNADIVNEANDVTLENCWSTSTNGLISTGRQLRVIGGRYAKIDTSGGTRAIFDGITMPNTTTGFGFGATDKWRNVYNEATASFIADNWT